MYEIKKEKLSCKVNQVQKKEVIFMVSLIVSILLIAVLIYGATRIIKIVPEAHCYVIEFLGSYKTTWTNGLHFKIPILERIAKDVSLKEQMGDFPPMPVITKDNVSIQIDTVVFYMITEPRKFVYGVENPILALQNLSATSLRNIIGNLDLDNVLKSRDEINSKMQIVLDEATDPWGIKVSKVELKTITPPADIQAAMEKQMQAERDKRATILKAEAHKESAIRRAEGDKAAEILAAEAERDSKIERAKGEAESIRLIYEAESRGIKMLNDVGLKENVLNLKKLDALKALGDGQATKLVVPTELATAATNLSFISDMIDNKKSTNDKKVVSSKTEYDPCCGEQNPDDVCCYEE